MTLQWTLSACRILVPLSLIVATSSFQPSHLHSNNCFTRHTQRKPIVSSSSSSYRGDTTTTSLNVVTPAAALSAIGSPIGSVAVLGFVILVHESGHFLAARSLGIDVDEFSVGVGPRIVGVRRKLVDDKYVFEKINDAVKDEEEDNEPTNNEGIEFSLRALPLGGYVRFPENYNRTLAFEQEDMSRRNRDEARMMRVENASMLEKVLESIAAKGFVLNIITLGLIKKWQAIRIEEQIQQAEEESQLKSSTNNMVKSSGGTWWKSLPFASNNNNNKEKDKQKGNDDKLAILKAAKLPDIDYFDDPNLLQNRPWNERAVVLSGGVVFNILLAFACYFGEVQARGIPSPVFDNGCVVSQVPGKDSPSFGLLKEGDIIVGVNGQVTSSTNTNSESIWASQKEISNVISTVRETPEGESVKLTIVHGKNSDSSEVISITPKRNNDGVASIGVMLGPNYLRTDVIKAQNALDAAAKAGKEVYQLTSQTASSIFGLLLGFLFGKGLPAGTSMSGPIGVLKSGADVVSSSDLSAVVAFAASISINLAVVNALPLPALDGGQLAFVLAEAAAGRQIDQRVQEGINAGALLILLIFSFGTAIGDVTSIFK